MPVLLVPLHEYNQCHEPAGSPVGGRFCGRDAFVFPAKPTPLQELLEPYGKDAGALREIRDELLARTRADGNEHLGVMQLGRPPEYFTSGDNRSVEVDEAYFDRMAQNPVTLMAHTHPGGDIAPSYGDLRAQVRTKTRRQVILGGAGAWYELTVLNFNEARAVLAKGRRYATYWEKGTKGEFKATFDRLSKACSLDAAELTDAWAVKTLGLTRGVNEKGEAGYLQGGKWVSRKAMGDLHPELRQYHIARFNELTPRIWIKLAEKYDWLTFRYHVSTGPYATQTVH